jgi:CheY-like chemotaxis protein
MIPAQTPPAFGSNPPSRPTRPAPVRNTESQTRILIIDNSRQVGISLSFMLSARGFDEIRSVRSAARALALSGHFLPTLVFLDLDLPDSQSLELAKQMRQDSRQRGMRLIALTQDAAHPRREEARASGFERFLTKPVENEELDKVLNRAAGT